MLQIGFSRKIDIAYFRPMFRRSKRGDTLIDRDNRTFICSVVYFDIADYSTKSVEAQIRLKDQLNRYTTEAIKNVAVNDRIILDTGDGVAICFLGDPEDALFVAMSLRDAVSKPADQSADEPLLVRFGINLGPVKLVNDINNRKNIIGDGINVGQRIMSFATPGQILVSRSYYEVVACLTQEYANLFHYLGLRSDKHIRKHELYSIIQTDEQEKSLPPTESTTRDALQIPAQRSISVVETFTSPPELEPALEQSDEKDVRSSASVSFEHKTWWRKKKIVFGAVAIAIFFASILLFIRNRDFDAKKVQPDQVALSPEPQEKNPGSPAPEAIIQSTGNADTLQTESMQPTHSDVNTIVPQDNPDETLPENASTAETAEPDKNEQSLPSPPAPNAILRFAVSPWGEIYVDGKRHGTSPPLTSVSIPPGKHSIEIRNSAFPPHAQICEIKPDEKLKIIHKFK